MGVHPVAAKRPAKTEAGIWSVAALGRIWLGLGRKKCSTGEESLDGHNQIAASLRFLDIAVSAGQFYVVGNSFRFMHGKNQDAGIPGEVGDQRGSFEAAHSGHGYVQDDDIGFQGFDGFDGLLAVAGFSANFPLWPSVLQHATHPLTNYLVIIDNQNSSAHRRLAAKVKGSLKSHCADKSSLKLLVLKRDDAQGRTARCSRGTQAEMILGVERGGVNRGFVVSITESTPSGSLAGSFGGSVPLTIKL